MPQFRISENGFETIRKTVLARTLVLLLVTICSVILINVFSGQDLFSWIYFGPFIAVILGVSLFRGLKRQKKIFESYRLTIDEETITREQLHMPSVKLRKSEVTQIIKASNGSFAIKGSTRHDLIFIPAQIDNIQLMEDILTGFGEITHYTPSLARKRFSWLLPLLILPLMVSVYISDNKLILIGSGLSLLSIMGFSALEITKSKNTDSQAKKISRLGLLIMGMIVAMAIIKLLR